MVYSSHGIPSENPKGHLPDFLSLKPTSGGLLYIQYHGQLVGEGRGQARDNTSYSSLILQVGDHRYILRKLTNGNHDRSKNRRQQTLGIQCHKQHWPEMTQGEKNDHCYPRATSPTSFRLLIHSVLAWLAQWAGDQGCKMNKVHCLPSVLSPARGTDTRTEGAPMRFWKWH